MEIASQREASGRTVYCLWALMGLYLLEAPRVLRVMSVSKASHLSSLWFLLSSFSQRRCYLPLTRLRWAYLDDCSGPKAGQDRAGPSKSIEKSPKAHSQG